MTHQSTISFYDQHCDAFIKRTFDTDMKKLYTSFLNQLLKGSESQILDLGCGSGRDSLYFAEQGFQVMAIDASDALICHAKQHLSHPNIHWQKSSFDELVKSDIQKQFTGIWACASLLHVPFDLLPRLIDQLLAMLVEDGILYASFKLGNADRMDDSRLFCDMNETRWQAIKVRMTLQAKEDIWITKDQLGRQSHYWFNVLMTADKC